VLKLFITKIQTYSDNSKFKNSAKFIHYHKIILYKHYMLLAKSNKGDFYDNKVNKIYGNYLEFNNLEKKNNMNFPIQEYDIFIINRNSKENKDTLKIGIASLKVSIKDYKEYLIF
jgi:hypothetical protein